MITKIAIAAVYVDDQEQAVYFWVEQMGFRIHREEMMGPKDDGHASLGSY